MAIFIAVGETPQLMPLLMSSRCWKEQKGLCCSPLAWLPAPPHYWPFSRVETIWWAGEEGDQMVAGEERYHMAGWRGGIWWAGEEGDHMVAGEEGYHMVGWGGGIP